MHKKMKNLIIIGLTFISINLSAQHPEIQISEKDAIEFKITQLIVTLDSATDGYTLPFDTLKFISFDKESGKKLKEIGYTSDVYYIQNKKEYIYFKDSVEILRIDSSLNAPAFLTSVDTTRLIHLMENGKLKTVKYYPWSKNNKLDWTKQYFYNSKGEISKIITINEQWKPKTYGVTVTTQSKSITEYFYNKEGKLIKMVNSSERTDNEKRETVVKYIYEDNKTMIISEREDFEGNKWNSKEEIQFNKNGKKTKLIEYDRNGEVWFTTDYTYYENGLLKSEESYKNGSKFLYRFVTKYK